MHLGLTANPTCRYTMLATVFIMSAREIKRLIGEFNDAHYERDYADFMITNKDLPKKEQEEWEIEADLAEQELYNIANQISELKPSKYMMEKYSELEYILLFV